MMNVTASYHLYAAITIFCWGVAYPVTTVAMGEFTSFGLAFLRYAVAAILVGVVIIKKGLKPPAPRDMIWFFACGLTGFVLYPIFFNYGCAVTPAAMSSTIVAVTPMITAAAAQFFLGEKLVGKQWAAILFAFSGVLVLLFDPGASVLSPGSLWLLGAAFCLGTYNFLQRKLTASYDSLRVSAYCILAGFLILIPLAANGIRDLAQTSLRGLICMLVLGVFSSAVAYISWAKAFSVAPSASSVSNYMFLTPFVAALVGFCISQEIPNGRTLLGGAIILSGMLLFQRFRKRG